MPAESGKGGWCIGLDSMRSVAEMRAEEGNKGPRDSRSFAASQ